MTDPPRLLDQTDNPLVADLLRAAQAQAPKSVSVQRTLLAVGTAASVVGGHATAAAAGGALGLVPLAKLAATWTVSVALLVGGGVAATELAFEERGPAQPSASAPQSPPEDGAPARFSESANRSVEQAADADQTGEKVHDSLVAEPSRASTTQAPPLPERRATRSHDAASKVLEREVALLDEARSALGRGDFFEAERAADRYLSSYPGGQLEPEARYLSMQARRGRGDLQGARREAGRLLEQDPTGPHTRAARELLTQP